MESLRDLGRALATERGFGRHEDIGIDSLEVSVRVPLGRTAKGLLDDAARALGKQVGKQLTGALRSAGAFEQGAVYCFLCESSGCQHARPEEADSTFSGYAANGKPEWTSFTNLLIARGEERVDRLFADDPEVVAITQSADELQEGLLPLFDHEGVAYRLLGQVVTGLVSRTLTSARRGKEQRVALTFQIVETTHNSGPRLRLNVLGLSPEEIADAAADDDARGPAEALRRTIGETRHRVDGLARRAQRSDGDVDLTELSAALLSRLRGDVERVFRPVQRRTRHAQERHQQGDRPTGEAMDDVRSASSEQFFNDSRRNTIVVLGPRNRGHIFTEDGRHVTSIRLQPGELEKKTERKWWTPMRAEGIAQLRAQLKARAER